MAFKDYIGGGGGAGGGHTIQDEGTPLTQRTNLNFIGGGVIVTDNSGNDATDVTINTAGASFVDQSGGTGDTFGVLAGAIDGANTTYTVSNGLYGSGTLRVHLNGQLQTQGTAEDWTETTPASGTFDFVTAPLSGDEITVEYNKTVSTVTVGVETAVSITTSGQNLIGVTDTSSTRTITIATADILEGSPTAPIFITIKDVSGAAGTNNITIDTEGSETIDGAASVAISVNFGVSRLYTNGTNLFTV